MPKKPLQVHASKSGNEWILRGTAYDRRRSIVDVFGGRWDPKKKAWRIPYDNRWPGIKDIKKRYHQLPYDIGSQSRKNQIRRKQLNKREKAYKALMNRIADWKTLPLSDIPSNSALVVKHDSDYGGGNSGDHNYELITGPSDDVKKKISGNSYMEIIRHDKDCLRGVSIAIGYVNTGD